MYNDGMKRETSKLLVNLFDDDRANLKAVMDRWHLPNMAAAIRFALALVARNGDQEKTTLATGQAEEKLAPQ